METKAVRMKDQSVDMDERTLSGYASTWDIDQGNDKIHPGAFAKSIREGFPSGRIKVLWQHYDPIGMPTEMREDDKGLFVKAKVSKTNLGDEALELMRDGVVDRMSIGFMIPQGKSEEDNEGIRHIREVKLMEFSPVTFPMNESAIITGVKQIERAIKNGAQCDDPQSLMDAIKSLETLIGQKNTAAAEPDPAVELRKSLDAFYDMIHDVK